jgi:hypothetical protein
MTEIKENLRYLQIPLRYRRNTIAKLLFKSSIALEASFLALHYIPTQL